MSIVRVALISLLLTAPVWATDPAAIRRDLEASRLDPDRAVTLKNVKLNAGLAMLHLEEGTLVPVTPVGGKTVELLQRVEGGEGKDAAGHADELEQATKKAKDAVSCPLLLGLLGGQVQRVSLLRTTPSAHPLFKTRAQRLGTVIRVSSAGLQVWRLRESREICLAWSD